MVANFLDLDEAVRLMVAGTEPVAPTETIPVPDSLGRITASPVTTDISLPPFAASAMDGYALRSNDLNGAPPYRLKLSATSYAGHPVATVTPPGGCVRIFTGAALPADLDAVEIQENCEVDGDAVILHQAVTAGANVRPEGHDVPAGGRILEAGRRITPFDQGWLTACGRATVEVRIRPVIGLFSTGDELLEVGMPQGPGQIFDANRTLLRALLAGLPVSVRDYGIVADDTDRIRQVLELADRECDLVLTSGGVSVGEADLVREVAEALGTLQFWKLNLKPGKPLAYGHLGRAAFFGLPGNPVSTVVTALMCARPVIERLCGTEPTQPLTVPARLLGNVRHTVGREEFQRGTLQQEGAELVVSVTGDQSSNRLASFSAADCLIRIPKDQGNISEGNIVAVLPFHALL